MNKDEITRLFNANRLGEAQTVLSAITDGPDHVWALYMLGRIAWKEGRKSDAISFYEKATAIDSGSEAATALEQARAVMDFFNKDLYNP